MNYYSQIETTHNENLVQFRFNHYFHSNTTFSNMKYIICQRIAFIDYGTNIGLWCLTQLSTIFQVTGSFIGGGNPKKTTDLPEVTKKLYYIMLYRVHIAMSGIQTHNGPNICSYMLQYDNDTTPLHCDII